LSVSCCPLSKSTLIQFSTRCSSYIMEVFTNCYIYLATSVGGLPWVLVFGGWSCRLEVSVKAQRGLKSKTQWQGLKSKAQREELKSEAQWGRGVEI
jgi:hypothetical protein